ncbi:ABC transporter substrate-binding protein [Acinetobacter sp. SwsAc6]|uniref:ABC transporter substrate-binding protein n=1 Tax=Acinetobacter cumulans TaxID=2136182 RepID=A0A498D748_9GAMM|nr:MULTISPECIES: ABC transporter substrate-binding protein [Acinetobacter]NWK74194.1 ABC transporter substrate-binding protein [Acinetobacter sp. SwsAc6]QCO22220.1 ABC transporter substrate-binding protein [Acinetobacter cumulans]RFS30986.1 ABC transporter substrate-binding protein [Acinetobacter sp. SWAC5]RKG46806.1 ABC transporter substrate-binding protein [Acinetobacter cumulans]RKG49706.1 ABC transporter substrate-binding protein [Acinetobacter cumulans]
MMKTAFLSTSILSVILLAGCDNTAKVPEPQNKTETTAVTKPITIGYSDWPGFVAWQVAIEKGWLKEAGVNVDFKWFDYSASLSAFAANQLDAVLVTNGDNLVTGSGGTKGVMIMATDYSAGNDVIIAKPGIESIADLKGKSVATEKGLVDHLLLATALEDAKVKASDIKLINTMTNELPQVFASPDIAAIAVWQPVANQALKAVAGSKIIYSSKDKPGLIYDTLTVNMTHLSANKEEWKKIIQVWDKTVKYINDPATHADAVKIMSTRVGVEPAQYEQFIGGTHLLDLDANKKVFTKGEGFDSLYGSSYHVNKFNVTNGIYKTEMDVDGSIYPALVQELK